MGSAVCVFAVSVETDTLCEGQHGLLSGAQPRGKETWLQSPVSAPQGVLTCKEDRTVSASRTCGEHQMMSSVPMTSKLPVVVELTVGRARADEQGNFCQYHEDSRAGWWEGEQLGRGTPSAMGSRQDFSEAGTFT